MIKGGYILQPRIIQESDISVAPPYVREIWNYLLREANCQDNKYNGHEIKRGQLFRSYEDIREGTKWFIGWRKMTYNENQTKKAMKYLRDTLRIATTKELGGVMITICKYDFYQTPKNYERTTKEPIERTIDEPRKNQPLPDNNKNEEELIKIVKNREEEFTQLVFESDPLKYSVEMVDRFLNYWTEKNKVGKMRYELEKVFEISKRLATWKKNDEKFNKSTKKVNHEFTEADFKIYQTTMPDDIR